jgi:hypothetical protein
MTSHLYRPLLDPADAGAGFMRGGASFGKGLTKGPPRPLLSAHPHKGSSNASCGCAATCRFGVTFRGAPPIETIVLPTADPSTCSSSSA